MSITPPVVVSRQSFLPYVRPPKKGDLAMEIENKKLQDNLWGCEKVARTGEQRKIDAKRDMGAQKAR